MNPWMIYGANGYTGELISRLAVRRGMQPVLAGRNGAKVEALANDLELDSRVFALDEPSTVREEMAGMELVLHCAGPFTETSAPMLQACIEVGAHYLDITGEIEVYRACHERDEEARKAGILVLPGAGFDVVPTDCMAAMLAGRLPGATRLVLAFEAAGGPSPGTAKTSFAGLLKGGCVRLDGALKRVPLAWKERDIPFADGPRHAMTIPWGDVYTAYISTGIPNIEVYMAVPQATIRRVRRLGSLRWLLALGPLRRKLLERIENTTQGPDAGRRASTSSRIWGEVEDADGQRVSAELHTPNGYDLTADAAVTIVRRLLEQAHEPGFATPSQLLGPEFVLELKGTSVRFHDQVG